MIERRRVETVTVDVSFGGRLPTVRPETQPSNTAPTRNDEWFQLADHPGRNASFRFDDSMSRPLAGHQLPHAAAPIFFRRDLRSAGIHVAASPTSQCAGRRGANPFSKWDRLVSFAQEQSEWKGNTGWAIMSQLIFSCCNCHSGRRRTRQARIGILPVDDSVLFHPPRPSSGARNLTPDILSPPHIAESSPRRRPIPH